MRGIIGYGAYVPYYRLQRSTINQALGSGAGRGTRAVASYDEDATSMAVEAGRQLLTSLSANGGGRSVKPNALYFATSTPPYLDKTNATVIHAALRLPSAVFAGDVGGAPRSVNAALRSALDGSRPTMVVASDVRSGRPGSADETQCGDAAVAWLIGDESDGDVIAEWLGGASATGEFLDRWRLPGWDYSRVWEERFGEHAYLPLVTEAADAAFKQAGLEPGDVDAVIIAGLHGRAVRGAARAAGVDDVSTVDDLAATVGNTGTPHAGLMLGSALDQAEPGRTMMIVHLADGVDVGFLRTTDAIASYTPVRTVADQIDAGNDGLDYQTFLTWRGFLNREPPRRPDPQPPAAPPSLRSQQWKYAFVGSKDRSTGTIHLPPQRVSVKGGAIDDMEPIPMADVPGTVATFTIDRLAYSLSPPVIAVVIDFDGGGRFQCQLTDADPDTVKIGDRVTMTFRKMLTADGIHNYFWKARPATSV
ncbi:MAG: OB-fold domain-containing protein [Acidimicrobiia bacterium]|nr:OB-fold domain-containing protein [Acidimicrobiia bacterium]